MTTGKFDQVMDSLRHDITSQVGETVSHCIEMIAEQFEQEPEANYSGAEVGAALRGTTERIREDVVQQTTD